MSTHSFQTSINSKKIKKEPQIQRKCSDVLLPRIHFNPVSELPSPALLKELNSPRSAAIVRRFREDGSPRLTNNKLLNSSLFSKDLSDLSRLFSRKPGSKAETFERIDEIISKIKHPVNLDFSSQMQQIKQLSETQEQQIEYILEENSNNQIISQVYSKLKKGLNLKEDSNYTIPAEVDKGSNEQLSNEENPKILVFPDQSNNLHTEINEPKLNEHQNFPCEFIENFDFQLNFSSPFKTQIKQSKSSNKENKNKGLSIEKNNWKNGGHKTPGTSTPCTTPILERKRLLSSSKIEDMTDMLPEKRDILIDFNELLNGFNNDLEVKQWRFEENEEWEFKDFKENQFIH